MVHNRFDANSVQKMDTVRFYTDSAQNQTIQPSTIVLQPLGRESRLSAESPVDDAYSTTRRPLHPVSHQFSV